MFEKGDRILAAVSGGIDSMVMLHLLQSIDVQVAVAHANFQLRGEQSDGDEAFAKMHSDSFGLPFFSTRFETNKYAIDHGLSVQMAARQLRYQWFAELAAANQYKYIATAHHQDDTIETLLFNLLHGQDVHGLLGVPVKAGAIIRPMLFATRADIEHYAAHEGIRWREDESNSTDYYTRNFLRHKIVPLLSKVNPAFRQALANGIEKNRGAVELLDQRVGDVLQETGAKDGSTFTLEKKVLLAAKNAAPVLFQVVRNFGFSLQQCQEVVHSLHAQPGKRWLSATHLMTLDRQSIEVARIQGSDEAQREVQLSGEEEVVLGTQRLSLSSCDGREVGASEATACMDADAIEFPLIWRPWRAGDSFQPLGMSGTKKVSDLLIDLKLSLVEKSKVTVLVSGDDIIWVVGLRISEKVKVTARTTRKILLKVS